MSRSQKWARFDKEYIPYDWIYDTKIWMTGGVGGNLLVRKGILKNINFWLSCNILKKNLIIGPYFLGCTTINRMMTFDQQGGITYKLISNEYILCSKMLMIYCSVDPTSGFENL